MCVSMSMAVRVARAIQIFIPALSLLILLTSTSDVVSALILFLWVVTALDSS
jgi:hypothetical protein